MLYYQLTVILGMRTIHHCPSLFDRLGRKHGVPTLLNAAPADPAMEPDLFPLADIFCVNETELEVLTGECR